MSAAVLSKGYIAIDQRSFDRRKSRRAHILLAQQFIDRSGRNSSQEHALRVHPAIALGSSAADEDRPRRAQCNQFIGIDRQILRMERPRILKEVPCHPVILLRAGYIFNGLAPVAAIEIRASHA